MPEERGPVQGRGSNRATLILADISGYTGFLASVGESHRIELESGDLPPAYPLMTTLLDAIVGSLTPPFTLSKLEGDAVFAYADDDTWDISGQGMLACMRGCYATFREHLRKTENALTCTCDACVSGARLDLKFILHHGSYVAQTIAGNTELLGPDVTTAHRMLKNDVVATTGWPAYALVSSAAAEYHGLPLDEAVAMDLAYEHVSPMRAYALPLSVES